MASWAAGEFCAGIRGECGEEDRRGFKNGRAVAHGLWGWDEDAAAAVAIYNAPVSETNGKIRVGLTGSSGLIGRRLERVLAEAGFLVCPVRRGGANPGEGTWNVESGEIRFDQRVEILVHLAGRNVGARWTGKVKREIQDSRGPATEKLCRYLAGLPKSQRPRLLVSASAVGIYGDRGDEVLTEESALAARGKSFLADVCLDWENATRPAEDAGIRVVHPRIGVVLSREGGALAKLTTPTKLFLGGPVGSGMQFLPWISREDLCRMIVCILRDPGAAKVINAAGPAPVRQTEFMRALGKVMHRPTVFPLPGFMVKLAFGQMGEEVLLSSSRAIPTRLPVGFTFEHATVEAAIRAG